MAKREDNRWSKIITEWCPIVMKRKRGGQNTKWSDDIAEMTGKDWYRGKQNLSPIRIKVLHPHKEEESLAFADFRQ